MRLYGLVLMAPLSVLLTACGKPSTENPDRPLEDDLVLAAALATDTASRPHAELLAHIRACRAELPVRRAGTRDSLRSAAAVQHAREAELLGDEARARTLLDQALALDSANLSALYLLGRRSEARRDTAGAMRAYCKYLSLQPTDGDATEARARLLALWRSPSPAPSAVPTGTMVTARTAASNGAPRVARVRTPVRRTAPRVADTTPVADTFPTVASSSGELDHVVGAGGSDTVDGSTTVDVAAGNGAGTPATDGDGAVAVETPPPAPRQTSGRTAQGAIVGAAVGAVIGAATGGKLKHVLIGAGAGAVIGAATGQATKGGSN